MSRCLVMRVCVCVCVCSHNYHPIVLYFKLSNNYISILNQSIRVLVSVQTRKQCKTKYCVWSVPLAHQDTFQRAQTEAYQFRLHRTEHFSSALEQSVITLASTARCCRLLAFWFHACDKRSSCIELKQDLLTYKTWEVILHPCITNSVLSLVL